MSTFIAELRRRSVFKVGAAYLVVGWIVVQVATTVGPQLELPAWAPRLVTLLVLLGFPVALVLAWAVELTPDGIKVDAKGAGGKRMFVGAGVLAALAIAWVMFDQPAPTGGAPVERSIAVLPFVNMSGDAENEFFSDGLSEEILNSLSRIDGLQVVGRTSSFQFKGRNADLREIGSKLGVATVLEGSVRRSADQARITAQLVRVEDGIHLWSGTYDRTLTDILAVQLDIAEHVAGAMDVLLDDAQRARMREMGVRDVEAFVAFQKGRALSALGHGPGVNMLETLGRADQEFARAVAIDPQFAEAHHARTDLQGHILLADSPTAEQRDAALAVVRRELDLAARMVRDPRERLHIEIDRQMYSDDWRGLAARVEALGAAPGCGGDSWFTSLFPFGVAPSMLADARRRIACDPLDASSYLDAAVAALWTGQPERTIELATAAEAAVGARQRAAELKVRALVLLGRLDQARALLAPLDRADPVVARLEVLLGAASGDDAAAIGARWAAFTRSNLVPERWVDGDLEVQALTGDRAAANRWAAMIDSRPAGPMRLASVLTTCLCGPAFDLDATPNFRARMAESGLVWPPPDLSAGLRRPRPSTP
jgi:TolB-like protein